MPNSVEIAKDAVEQFQKVQRHMLIAKEENAEKTYASLKKGLFIFKSYFAGSGCQSDRY